MKKINDVDLCLEVV